MTDASAHGSSLTVFGGPLNGKSLVLKPGLEEVLIGSGPDCHLRLELPGVSAVHARLRISGGGVAVLDPPSPRGVFVNDARVAGSRPVHDGDVLWLGPPTDPSSVMIRCRLAPAIAQLPAVQPAAQPAARPAAQPPEAEPDVVATVSTLDGHGSGTATGPRAPSPVAFLPDQVVEGRYRIVRFIAQGGMGEVYEAEDRTLHGVVALKTIRPGISQEAHAIERFKREIHLARRITHPNVCRIYDIGLHSRGAGEPGPEEVLFLTMELLPGRSLRDEIVRKGRLDPDEALPLIEQMAAGLDEAHAVGIIHRDFKSANVVLVPDARRGLRAVITDFGLARVVSPDRGAAGAVESDQSLVSLSQTGAMPGTPAYMAPEQVQGKALTPAADIYALGIVIYEMVTGARPFDGDSPLSTAVRRLTEPPPSPRTHFPGLDPRWEAAILRCLERNPEDRFPAAKDVARALRGEDVAAPTVRQQPPDDFVFVEGAPAAPSVSDAEAFVLDEEPTPSPPPDIPPAATAAPVDDGFFVMDEEPAPPLRPPEPVRPAVPPPAPPRPPAPSSPPRAGAGAAPVAPAKAPAAKAPAAQVPPTRAPAPAAAPHPPAAAQRPAPLPPAPGAARAPAEARPPSPVAASPRPEGRPAPTPPAPSPTPAPSTPPPPAAPRPVSPPRSTAAPVTRPRSTTAPRPRAAVPAPSAKARSKRPPLVGIVAAALLVVAGVAYVALRSMRRPEILGVSPPRARIGEIATITGRSFAASPGENVVLFGDARATVREASRQRLVVEVPELPATAGRDTTFTVTVRVGGRDSQPVPIAVFKAPRIHGLSPDVAMPGEEVTLAGSGWGPAAVVRFGALAAEVLENTPEAIRVRVPAIEGPPGTPAPVTVAMGPDASNEAPFLLGRLPLVQSLEPSSAAPGDVVTLTGRGFHWKAAENTVRVGGVRAFVATVGEGSLKFTVPWTSGAGGEVPIELREPSIENTWQGVLNVQPGADPIDFRFAVEPLDAVPASPHAVLATGLGPAFVLAAAERRTAADRALEAQRRLNDAATALKASRDVNFEVRNLETSPVLALAGRPEAILEVSDEDAAAYNEDWTKLGGKGGAVTRARLALWWQAVARDLVLLLLRGEKPRYAAALAPEGRVLGDVFEAARKTGSFGVPRSVIATARPPMTAALRTLALRVPASVTASVPEAPRAAKAAAAAAASPSPPPLQLEGMWVGTELEGGTRKYVTVTFRGRGGSLAYEGGISVSVPFLSLDQPQKDTVRYSIEYRGGQRYYVGRWDGRKITGRISSDASGRGDVGAFELSPR